MPDRAAQIRAFLAQAGWEKAQRSHLAGDASDRRYERLRLGGATAVLMDNPPGGPDDPAAFSRMARHLCAIGLSPPAILAEDLDHGILLLEDLGDDLYARLLAADPDRDAALYAPAVDVLLHLQQAAPPPGLPDLTAGDWAQAAGFALDWYAFAATGQKPDPTAFLATLTTALRTHADGPRVLILRDYHAENLLWLPGRAGLRRVGILDFQLGQLGQPGYDLVSLLQDARRDVALQTEAAMVHRFATARGEDLDRFGAHYATLGAQRALRILGIFVRLCLVGGKPQYLHLIPRVWGQLQRNLAHPALAELRAICDGLLPVPTPELLQKIERQCLSFPYR
ncbi:MAG TPA: phosphotransferase [Tabrizicola sp.]|nr:phosphotransferase [Tabrizicola sp.]